MTSGLTVIAVLWSGLRARGLGLPQSLLLR